MSFQDVSTGFLPTRSIASPRLASYQPPCDKEPGAYDLGRMLLTGSVPLRYVRSYYPCDEASYPASWLHEEITVNENDVISAFADLCGCLGLDPVDVLKVLNAQDWSQVEDISTARLKVHED